MFMFCMYIYVSVSHISYQQIEKLIIGNLNGNLCQTLGLWFPFKGKAFFDHFSTNEYDPVSGYPDGKCTPLYIFSM